MRLARGIIGFLCTLEKRSCTVHKKTIQHRTGATHNASTNFAEFCTRELRRIPVLRTWVNRVLVRGIRRKKQIALGDNDGT